jgi:hypothetical protein
MALVVGGWDLRKRVALALFVVLAAGAVALLI